jgi:hypothetical protein
VPATGVLCEVRSYCIILFASGVFTLRTFGTTKKYTVKRSKTGEASSKDVFKKNRDSGRVSIMLKLDIVDWLI